MKSLFFGALRGHLKTAETPPNWMHPGSSSLKRPGRLRWSLDPSRVFSVRVLLLGLSMNVTPIGVAEPRFKQSPIESAVPNSWLWNILPKSGSTFVRHLPT